MARILISEPHQDVRRLLERMVERLGHEPIAARTPTPEQLTSVDVFIVEPAAPIGAVLAQAAHMIDPRLPLICASVTAPPPELAGLGVVFAATLIKPFTLQQLHTAIERAFTTRCALIDDPPCEGSNHGHRAA
jgi:CheY-like chemotaxis protein